MAFDWREYVELSRFLLGASGRFSEEAAWRCAVSRAYYAAFGHARSHARAYEHFIPTQRPEDHDRLRDHLRRHGRGGLAQQLGRLRRWRNQCDYDDEVPGLRQIVTAAATTAQDMIDRL